VPDDDAFGHAGRLQNHRGCAMAKGNNSQKKEVKKPKKDSAKGAAKADKKK
jgi:hypothetical protein